MFGDFLVYYEANICVGTRLFPGAIALLDRFARPAGRSPSAPTSRRMSRLLLEKLGVGERFAAICGGDSFP